MDGGIDDALALILALKSPEINVVGITAVSGNVPVEQAATNALRVTELLDREDVWVAKGLANPLVREPIRATRFHGKDGLGDSGLPLPKLKARDENALTLIRDEAAKARSNELSLITTGPLTNIAAIFNEDPSIAKKLKELVIMGGAYGVTNYGFGNETPAAEFNIYSDPEAAKLVFESGVALKCVGLDVTMMDQAQLSRTEHVRIGKSASDVARFAFKILANNMQRTGCFALHDPMAVAAKVRLSLFTFRNYRVSVETKGEYTTGMTVADRRDRPTRRGDGRPLVAVCVNTRAEAFKAMFLTRLMSY